MKLDINTLDSMQRLTLALGNIFASHGYSQYKMGKFEEYDLYSKNKNFLVSDSVITFTDTNGKLMALKPDVTLSIIKNCSNKAFNLKFFKMNKLNKTSCCSYYDFRFFFKSFNLTFEWSSANHKC